MNQIEQARNEKIALEKKIEQLLNDYQQKYGVTIGDLKYTCIITPGNSIQKTTVCAEIAIRVNI